MADNPPAPPPPPPGGPLAHANDGGGPVRHVHPTHCAGWLRRQAFRFRASNDTVKANVLTHCAESIDVLQARNRSLVASVELTLAVLNSMRSRGIEFNAEELRILAHASSKVERANMLFDLEVQTKGVHKK